MPDPGAPEAAAADRIAGFAAASRDHGVPAEVTASVQQRVLDTLGLTIAALDLPTSRAALGWVLDQGGHPQAHAVGHPEPVTAGQAAFVNGVLAHSLDYDDTHLPSVLHPSSSVVPAALAAGELYGACGRQVVSAIAVGLEITVRLGMAGYNAGLRNSVFFEHGQHATSICGAIGAAVAVAMLAGHDPDRIRDTIGIAASMASGVIEANRTGGTVKRLHCGWAAHSGIAAAGLAGHGFTGPPTVLEGRFGFLHAFLRDQADPRALTADLGRAWAVPGIFFKPYPANHFTHAAIDAGLALRSRGVVPEDIAAMTLAVPHPVVRTIGQPIAVKRAPETGYQAQFSGPYALVAGLLGGTGLGVGRTDFSDRLARDPRRRRLMALVDVVGDDRCDAIFPFQFPAIATVRTKDATVITQEVLANRGGPQRPLTDAELAGKFHDNTAGALPDDSAAHLRDQALDLNRLPDVRGMLALAAQAVPPAAHEPTAPGKEGHRHGL